MTTFGDLPNELIHECLHYLPRESLLSTSLTSRFFYQISEPLLYRTFGNGDAPVPRRKLRRFLRSVTDRRELCQHIRSLDISAAIHEDDELSELPSVSADLFPSTKSDDAQHSMQAVIDRFASRSPDGTAAQHVYELGMVYILSRELRSMRLYSPPRHTLPRLYLELFLYAEPLQHLRSLYVQHETPTRPTTDKFDILDLESIHKLSQLRHVHLEGVRLFIPDPHEIPERCLLESITMKNCVMFADKSPLFPFSPNLRSFTFVANETYTESSHVIVGFDSPTFESVTGFAARHTSTLEELTLIFEPCSEEWRFARFVQRFCDLIDPSSLDFIARCYNLKHLTIDTCLLFLRQHGCEKPFGGSLSAPKRSDLPTYLPPSLESFDMRLFAGSDDINFLYFYAVLAAEGELEDSIYPNLRHMRYQLNLQDGQVYKDQFAELMESVIEQGKRIVRIRHGRGNYEDMFSVLENSTFIDCELATWCNTLTIATTM